MTKIGSNPGVRSDLFKRPLDKTRITDFFGGVAQVEVIINRPADSPTLLSMPVEEVVQEEEEEVSSSSSSSSMPPHSSDGAVAIPGLSLLFREWRMARAWASVGFIGVLVGWVITRR